jgi:hypothetical protein
MWIPLLCVVTDNTRFWSAQIPPSSLKEIPANEKLTGRTDHGDSRAGDYPHWTGVIQPIGWNMCIENRRHTHTHTHTYTKTLMHIFQYIHTHIHACIHVYKHIYACTHTDVHIMRRPTCLHTYVHMYVPTCIRSYIHTHIHTCMHACIRTYIRTCVRACVRAYIHMYVYTSLLVQVICWRAKYLMTCSHPYQKSHECKRVHNAVYE